MLKRLAILRPLRAVRLLKPSTPVPLQRGYASENHQMNPKIVELIYKMQSTPSVMEAITDFERIVKAKGLEDTGRMGKFVEMMKDKDVENALRKLITEMQKAGIKITPDIVGPILRSLAKE